MLSACSKVVVSRRIPKMSIIVGVVAALFALAVMFTTGRYRPEHPRKRLVPGWLRHPPFAVGGFVIASGLYLWSRMPPKNELRARQELKIGRSHRSPGGKFLVHLRANRNIIYG
jgi:hypothetical protein